MCRQDILMNQLQSHFSPAKATRGVRTKKILILPQSPARGFQRCSDYFSVSLASQLDYSRPSSIYRKPSMLGSYRHSFGQNLAKNSRSTPKQDVSFQHKIADLQNRPQKHQIQERLQYFDSQLKINRIQPMLRNQESQYKQQKSGRLKNAGYIQSFNGRSQTISQKPFQLMLLKDNPNSLLRVAPDSENSLQRCKGKVRVGPNRKPVKQKAKKDRQKCPSEDKSLTQTVSKLQSKFSLLKFSNCKLVVAQKNRAVVQVKMRPFSVVACRALEEAANLRNQSCGSLAVRDSKGDSEIGPGQEYRLHKGQPLRLDCSSDGIVVVQFTWGKK